MQPQRPVRVAMVCLGNICRSPTAEGVLRHMAAQRGLSSSSIIVTSSGTSGHWHEGEQADHRTISHAAKRGYDLSQHRASALKASDFETNDYLLAMDANNLSTMKAMCPKAHQHKLHLLLDFAPKDLTSRVVPDPYYSDAAAFELVIDLVEKGCTGFITHILTQRASSTQAS